MESITPEEVKYKLDNNENFRLIDVREAYELEICNIKEAEHFPISTIVNAIDKFKEDDEIIFFCHHGFRSAQVCTFFLNNGFKKVKNMTGGIDLWSETVDNTVPKY